MEPWPTSIYTNFRKRPESHINESFANHPENENFHHIPAEQRKRNSGGKRMGVPQTYVKCIRRGARATTILHSPRPDDRTPAPGISKGGKEGLEHAPNPAPNRGISNDGHAKHVGAARRPPDGPRAASVTDRITPAHLVPHPNPCPRTTAQK